MEWRATARYELKVAPGGFGFVHELLNTLSAGKPRLADLLGGLDEARGWLTGAVSDWAAATGRVPVLVELSSEDLPYLRRLRDELRALIEHGPRRQPVLLNAGTVVLETDDRGWVRAEPRGSGWKLVASIVLIEMLEAQRADQWRRLKTCRNGRCSVAFYDRSRNNSGVWHNVQICGNAMNLQAYRARKRSTQHS